jgi:membrane protease YdiL (CAAX protease family)
MKNHALALLGRYPLVAFFVLSFVLAWMVWIPAGWAGLPFPIVLLGAVAPSVAALILTGILEGRTGMRCLLRRATRYRVRRLIYSIAILGPVLVGLFAAGIATVFGGPPLSMSELPLRLGLDADAIGPALGLLPFIFAGSFLGGPLLEEIGWRGFAQPRMQKRIGAGAAGLWIGLAWSLWHLPLLHFYPMATAGIPLPYYLPLVTAFGICFAWVHVRSRSSVLLTIILHASVNFAFGAYGPVDVTTDALRLLALVGVTVLVALVAFADLRRTPRLESVAPVVTE